MGGRLIALAASDDTLEVVAAVDRASHPGQGEDSGRLAGAGDNGVLLTDEIDAVDPSPDVWIDFSAAEACRELLAHCVEHGVPVVIGTTGLTADDDAAIDEAGKRVPVIYASNFSLVVNALHVLAARAAEILRPGYDVEVLEAHHRFKKDAPSGTAIALATTVARARGQDPEQVLRYTRHGDDVQRTADEITLQAVRIGDHPGEHTVFFAGLGERLELRHVSTSRDSYAAGALFAAKWLPERGVGRYTMVDVLGL